jgi:hypothetical protein
MHELGEPVAGAELQDPEAGGEDVRPLGLGL